MIGNIFIVISSIVGMEVFALYFHKHFMHGRGWNWHESHHVHTDGYFEKNDLYAVCFSVIAAALFIAGSLWWTPLWYMALGFTIYGVLYGFVHDGLVHPLFWLIVCTIIRPKKMAPSLLVFFMLNRLKN